MSSDCQIKLAHADGPVESADVDIEHLQSLSERLLSNKQLKHAIVAVESGDGSFRWTGAAGDANPDGTPMQADTPFFIASVTKLYTATVVMQLYERGHIGLDEPITDYLPKTLIGGAHRLGGVDYTDSITIRHLLSHTSGLPDYFEDRPRGGRSLAERLFSEGDMALSTEDVMQIVREQLTPHFPPQRADAKRRKVRYSDTNYHLLAVIIETVTGRALHQVFEEKLIRPLELGHTYLYGHSQPLEATPAPATIWVDKQPLDIPLAMRSMRAEGGIVSMAEDMLTFLRALTRGAVFDDPGTFTLMKQHWNRFGFPLDRAALRLPGWPIEYGLGVMHFRLPRLFTPLRPIPAVVGHTGSSGSWLFYCPQLDVYLCGTVDHASAGAVPYRFVPKLLRVLDSAVR